MLLCSGERDTRVAHADYLAWSEAPTAGSLMGIKTVLNEFLAYLRLAELDTSLSERTRMIMTYALCGMANFGSLGIMIGGLTAMVPERP